MVKNTKGGKSHKKMASKNFKADQRRPKLRKVREEGEDFAVVLKISGGGCLVVQCNSDGKERTCIIRGKFKGRNKRSNQINDYRNKAFDYRNNPTPNWSTYGLQVKRILLRSP